MPTTVRLRDARHEDAEAITEIYNDAVRFTTAIWNETTVDVADREQWMRERVAGGAPLLVAVDEQDQVIGYATWGPFRPHEGYRHSREHSVYVHADHRGQGIGTVLLRALIAEARMRGVHVLVGGISAENEGSIWLHERAGFTRTGTIPQAGRKFDRWLDLAFLTLVLDGSDQHPSGHSRSL